MRILVFALLGLVCCGSASGTDASTGSAPGSEAAVAVCQAVAGAQVDASDALLGHLPDGGACCSAQSWAETVCAQGDAGEACDFFFGCCVSCRR